MSDKISNNVTPIDLEFVQMWLFQSSKKLNLSKIYEAIPKDVSKNDPNIQWVSEHMANPVEKNFTLEGQNYVSEITPATTKDKKTGKYKSRFPELREARIEYAIISIVSKQYIDIETDSQHNKIFRLYTTYYQIQKEIIDAINKVDNKSLKPQNCPYNITEIKEALEVLKKTNITVRQETGEGVYIFTRIKDISLDNKKVCIELGTMITSYINNGDWIATDTHRILASRGRYELRLRVLLNLRFRYASKGASYTAFLSFLIDAIDFVESKQKRTTLQRMVKELEKMDEVEHLDIEKVYDGRRLIDAKISIHASENFVSTMIENNKLSKRTKTSLIDENGLPLIEPLLSDFQSKAEYHKAKVQYQIDQGKALFNRK
tara:strand:+ start:1265 stop:2389 length:1125 start_codon:yes stop_codon:yes gene_type:complete